jgi:hypothetical protein
MIGGESDEKREKIFDYIPFICYYSWLHDSFTRDTYSRANFYTCPPDQYP